jgi:hypothetical protein
MLFIASAIVELLHQQALTEIAPAYNKKHPASLGQAGRFLFGLGFYNLLDVFVFSERFWMEQPLARSGCYSWLFVFEHFFYSSAVLIL